MKGLLIKDFYTLVNNRRQFALMLIIGVVFTIVMKDSGQYMSLMFTLVIMMSVYSSFSYDETANWNRYAVCLPVTRKSIVLSKYIMLLFCMTASLLITGGICGINALLGQAANIPQLFASGALSMCVMFFSICVAIPFIYQWGAEKARLISIIGILLPVLLLVGIEQLLPGHLDNLIDSGILFFALLGIFLLASIFLSFLLSVHIYSKKEF